MIFSMHIEADATPAMLERILQTTRVRGFAVRSMEVRNLEQSYRYRITLTVESTLPQNRLTSQLEKITGLHDLTALHGVEPEMERYRSVGT